jgi:hypothetical protein
MTEFGDNVVHLGVVGPHAWLYDHAEVLTDLGFTLDGDSFREWGESLENEHNAGDPAHVTVHHDGACTEEDVETYRSRLARVVQPAGLRLLDFAVVTDAYDWSTRSRVYSRHGVPLHSAEQQ